MLKLLFIKEYKFVHHHIVLIFDWIYMYKFKFKIKCIVATNRNNEKLQTTSHRIKIL